MGVRLPERWVWWTVAAVLAAMPVAALAGPDPVRDLQAVLRAYTGSDADRIALQRAVDRVLQSGEISNYRRALVELVADWKAGAAERRQQERISTALQKGLERAAASGTPASRLAAVTLMGELGVTVGPAHQENLLGGIGRAFVDDLTSIVGSGAPAALKAEAILSLGKILLPEKADQRAKVRDSYRAMLGSSDRTESRAAGLSLVSLVILTGELAKKANPAGIKADSEDVIGVADLVFAVAPTGLQARDDLVRRYASAAVRDAALVVTERVRPETIAVLEAEPRQKLGKAMTDLGARAAGLLRDRAMFAALADSDAVVRTFTRQALEYMTMLGQNLAGLSRALAPAGDAGKAADPLEGPLADAAEAVLAKLDDPSRRVRLAAVAFLEVFHRGLVDRRLGVTAAEALARRLEDCDVFVRWAAARTLGKLGGYALEKLNPEDEQTRARAASIRQTLTTVVQGLAGRLFDPDLDARIAAARGLEAIGTGAKSSEIKDEAKREDFEAEALKIIRLATPALIEAAQHGDARGRIAVLEALGVITVADAEQGERAALALSALLDHPDPDVRETAAETLGDIGPLARAAVPALERALSDPVAAVRVAAGDAILNIQQAVPREVLPAPRQEVEVLLP